ncbi:unnamed protein product [marine sediment metagenome]|uniref:Uncharacterized protein n=1 Tax=marine sediment metagenome TaxID=412755 RepID=X1TP29_9ZZZZ
MIDRNQAIHYCYVGPSQLVGKNKYTYALGDAFATGVSLAEAAEVELGETLPESTVVSIGTAVATVALLYGYHGINWSRIDSLVRSGCIRHVFFGSIEELAQAESFSFSCENLEWAKLLKLPSSQMKDGSISILYRFLAEE